MILNKFGKKIKDSREKVSISQLELSRLTGIGREQISRIENGQVNLTLQTIYRLSEGLATPLNELMNFLCDVEKREEFQPAKDLDLKPFVKWAGGKSQVLPKIKELLPKKFNLYIEPFIGGGALFFDMKPRKAIISNYNKELMIAYKCFEDEYQYERLVKELETHEENHSEDYYLKIRSIDRDPSYDRLPMYQKAARLIYLNKACFNGLYRVNSKGFFNVPSGKKEKVNAFDRENFNSISKYFNDNCIQVRSGDFSDVLNYAKKGDFVYFDPPYDSYEDNGFTSYTENSFGKEEQERLATVYKDLSDRGVYVMLSNHNTPFINSLYRDFNINVIMAKRMINSKGSGRGAVEEVIVTNY